MRVLHSISQSGWRALAVLVLVLLLTSARASAQALPPLATEEEAAAVPQPRIESAWRSYWQRFAARCAALEGEYVVCPYYDKRYDSNASLTVEEALRGQTRRRTVRVFINLTKQEKYVPPRAEAQALAQALPEWKIGNYGYIHSAEVVEVRSPTDMIVRDIWLVDADDVQRQIEDARLRARAQDGYSRDDSNIQLQFRQRLELIERQGERTFQGPHRIVGFNTYGLKPGDRWRGDDPGKGIQLAVVKADDPPDESKERRSVRRTRRQRRQTEQLVAVDLRLFANSHLTEAQLLELLEQRGLSQRRFAASLLNLLQQKYDEKEDDPVGALLESIEFDAQQRAQKAAAQEQ